MTTYPLEFYLCTRGTPHIKIVDPNLWQWMNPNIDESPTVDDTESALLFRWAFSAGLTAKTLYFAAENNRNFMVNDRYLELTAPEKHVLALVDSDYHLLLVLRFGERDWIELGEDDALAMMAGELAS
jgi:hypothetical protein